MFGDISWSFLVSYKLNARKYLKIYRNQTSSDSSWTIWKLSHWAPIYIREKKHFTETKKKKPSWQKEKKKQKS